MAFDSGNLKAAIDLLLPELDRSSDPRVSLVLGESFRQLGDDTNLVRAADRLLMIDPAQIRPLIWKGDALERLGDHDGADHYYASALDRAEDANIPPALAVELRRVEQFVIDRNKQRSDFLENYLRRNGIDFARQSSRISKSIDILVGRTEAKMGHQKPTIHYVPDLPERTWYERGDFPWVAALEAQAGAIRDELLGILKDDSAFVPYVEGNNHGPVRDYQGLLNNPAWGAFYLWRDGVPERANIDRCPVTSAALEAVPQPAIQGRTPTAMFSLLKPGTHIPAHHGMLNARLICHLPLVVPNGCAMRVGSETRSWTEGKLTIFDDTVEHEAWNKSPDTRVVLLFDIARPELDEDEMQAVRLCFAAADAYRSAKGD